MTNNQLIEHNYKDIVKMCNAITKYNGLALDLASEFCYDLLKLPNERLQAICENGWLFPLCYRKYWSRNGKKLGQKDTVSFRSVYMDYNEINKPLEDYQYYLEEDNEQSREIMVSEFINSVPNELDRLTLQLWWDKGFNTRALAKEIDISYTSMTNKINQILDKWK